MRHNDWEIQYDQRRMSTFQEMLWYYDFEVPEEWDEHAVCVSRQSWRRWRCHLDILHRTCWCTHEEHSSYISERLRKHCIILVTWRVIRITRTVFWRLFCVRHQSASESDNMHLLDLFFHERQLWREVSRFYFNEKAKCDSSQFSHWVFCNHEQHVNQQLRSFWKSWRCRSRCAMTMSECVWPWNWYQRIVS